MFKKILINLTIGILLLLPICVEAAKTRISLAVDHSPPYSYIDGEKRPKGLLIDIMSRMARELDFSLTIMPCPFSRCLKLVEQGQVDMMGGLIHTKEREKTLQFLEPAYMVLNSSFVFYTLNDGGVNVNNYEELVGKRIGVMRGGVYFEQFDNDKRLNKVATPSEKTAMDLLFKGRLDLVVAVEATTDHSLPVWSHASHRVRKVRYHHKEQILGHAVLSRKFADEKLAKQIKAKMKALAASGELDRIVSFYGLPPIKQH